MHLNDSWGDFRQPCMHGVREGVDSHDCAQCRALAKEMGQDTSNGKTYLYKQDPRSAAHKSGDVAAL